MEINRENHYENIIGNDKTGIVVSPSAEVNLLFAILEKLEEIRCGIIDVENAVNPNQS